MVFPGFNGAAAHLSCVDDDRFGPLFTTFLTAPPKGRIFGIPSTAAGPPAIMIDVDSGEVPWSGLDRWRAGLQSFLF